jgi:aerobic carbon-monoxide dehydrogenase large subunit
MPVSPTQSNADLSADALAAPPRFGSSRSILRVEDAALLKGQGRYTGDEQPAAGLALVFVRSPVAHGRITGIDTSAALALPGVVAVHTGASMHDAGVHSLPPAHTFKRADGQPIDPPRRPPLAQGTVGFVGEAVAAVVAINATVAREAADLVQVDIDPLPAVTGLREAVLPSAPAIWPGAPHNVVAELRHGSATATEAAFQGAAHHVRLHLVNQRLAPASIEPRTVLAWMDDARLRVQISSQMPTAVRTELAHCLPGLKASDIRVTVGDVGGGFGMKTGLYAEDVVVAWAAMQAQRPVKWAADRSEEFLSALHGRDLVTDAELALDAQGKILGLRLRSHGNVGAYPTFPGVLIALQLGPMVTTGVYHVPVIDFHLSAVLTHTAPTGPYRGAGRPEAVYIMERLMDAAARQTGIAPDDLRRRNFIQPQQMPYTNPMAQTYDSGQFERVLDQGLAIGDWAGYAARAAASRANGKLRGRALTTFLEWTGGPTFEEKVDVRVAREADGDVIEMTSATMAMGQGIATSYVQLAVDVFGVPPERVRILQGDTDRANGFGSAASRSLFTGGAAVKVASQRTVEHAQGLASDALEVAASDLEYREGRFTIVGTDRGISLFDIAARQPGAAFNVSASAKADAPSWPNACMLTEVEIDPDTGDVSLARMASVNDIGRVVHPTIATGQVEGGAMQGIGQALYEGVHYDSGGQLLTASFMDYAMPRADQQPAFATAFDQSVPCLTNSLGAKGVGELGTIGATPVVVNAVIDALASLGKPAITEAALKLQMPITPEKVWRVLQSGAGS